MGRETRGVWQERVARWQGSGVTAEEFARREGLRATTLRHWKWQLGAEERGWQEGRQRTPKFVEVVPAKPVATGGSEFEIVLADGVLVRVPPHFEGEGLRRLLEILQGRAR